MVRCMTTRRQLFELIRERPNESRDGKKEYVIEHVISACRGVEDCLSDSVRQDIRNFVSKELSSIFTRWEQCNRTVSTFERKYGAWLDGSVAYRYEPETKSECGRQPVSFAEAAPRTKRLKCEPLLEEYSAQHLLHAASMQYRKEGREHVAKLLNLINDHPDEAEKIWEMYKTSQKRPEPQEVTAEDGLLLLLEGNFSKAQYALIKKKCCFRSSEGFPSYVSVLQEKEKSYPANIKVTKSSAEVALQDMLDNDSSRVIKLLEKKGKQFYAEKTYNFIMTHKWGVDGSGAHSEYKQSFDDTSTSDKAILLTAISPLELRFADECDPLKEDGGIVVWTNEIPNSTLFCKPIRIQMKQESKEVIRQEQEIMCSQIAALRRSTLVTEAGATVVISHNLVETMLDGKVRGFLLDTHPINCCICQAKPTQMKCSKTLPFNAEAFKFGLPVLHTRTRFLDCVLHIGYKLDVKQWRCAESVYKARKERIQSELRTELGVLVDIVKQGVGTTNDGNTARTVFKNPGIVAAITGVDEVLLTRLSVIQDTLACRFPIQIEKFRAYLSETADLFETLYPWYYMPSAVHTVLKHGADIVESMDLPMGVYSEEAPEALNKVIRAFREHRTRKMSREVTMQDLFQRLLLSGDMYFSTLRKQSLRTSMEDLPQAVKDLLQ